MSNLSQAADSLPNMVDSLTQVETLHSCAQPAMERVADVAAIALNSNIDFGNVVLYAIIAVVLIICSAMASGSEVAFFSLTHNDIDELESDNSVASRRVLELLSNPDRLLATILVTNNMVNICLVIITTQLVHALFVFSGVWEFVFNTKIGRASCRERV